jgi:hypothetical protein
MVMKRLLPIVLFALTATACNLYVVEPQIDRRDRVVGYYIVDEYSHTYNDNSVYSVRISKSGISYDAVNIDNFYASGVRVKAYLNYDRITIPYQVVDGFEIEGVGTIFGDGISLTYKVTDLYKLTPTDFCDSEARFDY